MASELISAGLLVQDDLWGVSRGGEKVQCPLQSPKKDNQSLVQIPKVSEKIEDVTRDPLKPLDDHHHHNHSSETIKLAKEIGTDLTFKRQIVWFNAIGFLALHICAVYGVYLMFSGQAKIWTTIYAFWLVYASGQGVTMGAHRLWAHRSFKANKWVRIFLLYMHTLAGQNCLWVWVRDHRQHHKYSDTDADPHNANRGFFFSHIGWLMSRKHPKVIEYGKKIDMSDLEADPYIMFQKKYYKLLYIIFALWMPTAIPCKLWGENGWTAFWTAFIARTVLNLNGTWLVNSAAHMYGTKPFDKTMSPVESAIVSILACGEGWHNYHHVFPWDYKASEYGTPYNLTRRFIDFFARRGWVWDRREASLEMVQNRVIRTGDGSHKSATDDSDENNNSIEEHVKIS